MWIPSRVNKAGNVVPAFQVDECFAEEVKKYNWTVDGNGYLVRNYMKHSKRYRVHLHRFIWSLSGNQNAITIDHINHDVQDNRLSNLRAATRLLNGKNIRSNIKPGRLLPDGVTKQPGKRFNARIKHRGCTRGLGSFDTAEEASAVYQNAKEILIEFANLPGYENVIKGGVS